MSKSRNDRGKTPSGYHNVQPVTQNAVIAGKFMESDWNELLENESNEDFIADIINEVVKTACDKVFDSIIKSRLQPYSVFAVKQLLLDVIQQTFLQCDQGETNTNTDPSWIEDEEPTPSVTDSWAQGAVPVVPEQYLSPIQETFIEPEDGTLEQSVNSTGAQPVDEDRSSSFLLSEESDTTNSLKSVASQSAEENKLAGDTSLQLQKIDENKFVQSIELNSVSPQPPKQKKKDKALSKRMKNFNVYTGSLPSFQPISLTPVTDDPQTHLMPPSLAKQKSSALPPSETLLRIQHGRPPGQKEVVYDERGNVIHVPKINIDELPKQSVQTKYKIVDMVKESEKNRFTSKHKVRSTKTKKSPNSGVNNALGNTTALIRRLYVNDPDVVNGLRTPLPPPIIDAIDVADGVLVREGELFKKGMKHKLSPRESKEDLLHPISSTSTRVLNANEVLAGQSPVFRSLHQSKPLPPIFSR